MVSNLIDWKNVFNKKGLMGFIVGTANTVTVRERYINSRRITFILK